MRGRLGDLAGSWAMRSSAGTIALLVGLLVAAVLLDSLVVQPEEIPVAILYALPMLVVSHRMSPVGTVAFAALVIVVYLITNLSRAIPMEIALPRALSLVLVGGLAFLLALRIQEARDARREAERQRDRARAAHSELQAFLAMAAHDLGQPLTTILGRISLALRAKDLADHTRRDLDETLTHVRRMERLVRDLLDAGRIGAGEFDVSRRPMDLVPIISETVASLDAVSPAHQIDVEAPERLEGEWDPDRIAQVLLNLLSNAIRYTPDGGRILVRAAREADGVVVSVKDPGVGLAPEQLDVIFDAFARAPSGRRIGGTGLGLYITRGIVRAHGGRIRAESAGRGSGSTFSFWLPRAAAAATEPRSPG